MCNSMYIKLLSCVLIASFIENSMRALVKIEIKISLYYLVQIHFSFL